MTPESISVPPRPKNEPRTARRPRQQLQTFGGFTIVPKPEYPGVYRSPSWPKLYRVRRPDGSLTDMVNLTRARDAARHFAEQAYRQELSQAA